MGSPFAVGKKAFGFCDRCGFRYLLVDLRIEVVALQDTSMKVCPQCFDPDQPQLQLGRHEFNDPQALRNPRPDIAQAASRYGVSIRYEFTDDAEYWRATTPTADSTLAWQSDGSLLFTGTGDTPSFGRDGEGIPVGSAYLNVLAATYDKVRMRFKMTTLPDPLEAWVGALYWIRASDETGYLPTRKVATEAPEWIVMGDQSHVITWDLKGVSNWDGLIGGAKFQLFDFQSYPGFTNGAIEIDYVRFESDDEQT